MYRTQLLNKIIHVLIKLRHIKWADRGINEAKIVVHSWYVRQWYQFYNSTQIDTLTIGNIDSTVNYSIHITSECFYDGIQCRNQSCQGGIEQEEWQGVGRITEFKVKCRECESVLQLMKRRVVCIHRSKDVGLTFSFIDSKINSRIKCAKNNIYFLKLEKEDKDRL